MAQHICQNASILMGEHNHLQVTLNSAPRAEHAVFLLRDDWKGPAQSPLVLVRKVARAGADFAICPDITCHQPFEDLLPESPIPWLLIAEVVAEEADLNHFKRLGILGTRFLMEGAVYPETLMKHGIPSEIPDKTDREWINTIIFKELVNGVLPEGSRLYFNQVMNELKEHGCDVAVLGDTEIPLIIRPDDAPLPTLNSTRLLARAALRKALGVAEGRADIDRIEDEEEAE